MSNKIIVSIVVLVLVIAGVYIYSINQCTIESSSEEMNIKICGGEITYINK
jgi:hypothetical protein